MTPLPIIANTYRVAMEWEEASTSQTATNVMHFQKAGTTALALAGGIDAAMANPIFESAVSTAGVNVLHVTPLDGSSASINYEPASPEWEGAQSGDFIPAAAVVVSLSTALRGRSYRGRVYIPFTGETWCEDGTIGSHAASVQSNWHAQLAAWASAGYTPVIASYKLAAATPIIASSVLEPVGTQRRRQTRVRYP